MAVVAPLNFDTSLFIHSDRVKLYVWTLTTADATGDGLIIPSHADKTIQAYGTWGSGTLTLQGANHPTVATWTTLTDGSDNDIVFTANKIEVVAQNPYHIRPVLTGSTGATVTVIIAVRY